MKKEKHLKSKEKENKKTAQASVDKKMILRFSLIIGVVAFFLYSNTLSHSFVLDDYSVIKENQLTQKGTAALKEIFKSSYREGYSNNENNLYRPLSKAMFAIEWQVSPNNPSIHHFMNVLLYSIACILLFFVLISYTKINTFLVFLITILFVAHPIHTEVVANIKSRDEIMSMIFLLSSLLFISKYLKESKSSHLIISLACFFLALLSKESAIVYVALAPLFIYFFKETSSKTLIKISGSILAVAILYIIIHISIIGSLGIKNIPVIDNSILFTSNVGHQKLTAILIMGIYFMLLLFPHPLSSDYSFDTIPIVTSIGNIGFLFSLAFHLFILIYAIKKIKEKHLLSFCIFFYFISMALASNIFMLIGTHLAERLLFFPSIAFCIALVYFLSKLFKTDLENVNTNSVFSVAGTRNILIVSLIITTAYSFKTIARNKDWKSDTTLFGKDLQTVPNSAHMLFYHANHMTNKDTLAVVSPQEKEYRLKTAQKNIEKALKLYELFPDAHNVAGKIYYEQKNYEAAFKSYSRASEMNPQKGMYHNNIGTCLFSIGNYPEAIKAFQKAIEINKYDAEAQCNLGSAYGAMGESYKMQNDIANANQFFLKAIESFKKATEIKKDYKSAYQFIGLTYRNIGDEANAQQWLNKAASIK